MSTSYPQYPLTTFPEQVDNFKQFLDVAANDYVYLKQYQDAIENGDKNAANQALSNISDADKKVLTAKRFNELREAVLVLEQFYGTDIEPYIDAKQTEWENIINRFEYKGDYEPSTTYYKNNIVKYNDNGIDKLYLNIYDGNTVGIVPTNTLRWRELTIQGQRGEQGSDSSFQYAWDSGTSYNANAIVVYNNTWWNSLQPNQNKVPSDGSQYWQQVLSVNTSLYPVQPNEPISQVNGELWFKVLNVL